MKNKRKNSLKWILAVWFCGISAMADAQVTESLKAIGMENITTRFRTEFDYQLKIMPDTAQREVILEIIHKHKEYLAFLESALAEDAQTADRKSTRLNSSHSH